MKLSPEEARRVVYEDTSDFELIEKNVIDTSRWSIQYEGVFKHIETEKFYRLYWDVGATEYQDSSPFEYETDYVPLEEVVLKEVLVKKWIRV